MTRQEVFDSPPVRYLQAKQVGELENRYVQVTGEFVTAFGKAYRITTDIGPKWVSDPGTEITPIDEEVVLRTETPLFAAFTSVDPQIAVLQPQTVTAFEKTAGFNSERDAWYHVRTPQGEGWITRSLAEPEDAKAANIDIQLHGQTTLYQYPDYRMMKPYDPLGAQTVHVHAYWNDEFGQTWLRIDSYAGKAWLQADPRLDRLTMPDEGPQLQILFTAPRMLPYAESGDELQDFNHGKAGFVQDGIQYLSVAQLAQAFGYKVSAPDSGGYITLQPEKRYAFQIKAGERTALTLWNGRRERSVPLQAAPQMKGGELYLQAGDAETLFGAFIIHDDSGPVYYLAAKEYAVEPAGGPEVWRKGAMPLKAFLYDQPEKSDKAAVRLFMEDVEHADTPPGQSGVKDKGMNFQQLHLYELEAAPERGGSKPAVVLKVGERILWKQELSPDSP